MKTIAIVLMVATLACATNPVTGKRELTLMSESQEIEMGRQGAAEVAAAIGLYPNAALQGYVSRIGLALAAASILLGETVLALDLVVHSRRGVDHPFSPDRNHRLGFVLCLEGRHG